MYPLFQITSRVGVNVIRSAFTSTPRPNPTRPGMWLSKPEMILP